MMRKRMVLFLLVITVLLCFCACRGYEVYRPRLQKPSDNLDILTANSWEYDFESCAYTLSMRENGEFSNSCACGSPVGDSDIIEHYIYDDETKKLYLYDYEDKCIDEYEFLEISKDKIVVKQNGEVCTYVPWGKN